MDYLIRNGMVMDPTGGMPKDGALLVRDGVIRAFAGGEPPPGAECIDAAGCYVVPGLVDSHLHVNRANEGFGENADLICLPNGVTCAIDAGSCGVETIEALLEKEIHAYETDVRVLAHVVSKGQHVYLPDEVAAPDGFAEERLLRLFQVHPDRLKGLKIRCQATCTAGYGLAPLRRAIAIAERIESEGLHCPVTVHIGPMEANMGLRDLLETLRPGDVVAHVFQGAGETILDENGKVKQCVWRARERGVLFDFAHGRTNFTFPILQAAAAEGFFPDLLGTDIHAGNSYLRPAFSLMQTLSMMAAVGMPMEEMIRAVTRAPAKAYGLWGTGSFTKGGADLAILRWEAHPTVLEDRLGNRLEQDAHFATVLTMRAGKARFRQGWR